MARTTAWRTIALIVISWLAATTAHAQQCQPGTVGPGGQEPCVPCSVGRYQDQAGQEQCPPCPTGTFSNTTGATACTPCAPGTFTPFVGSFFCSPCPIGQYQPAAGEEECLPCPGGTQVGQSTCATAVPASSAPWMFGLGVALLAALAFVMRRRGVLVPRDGA